MTLGKYAKQFEEKFAEYLGTKYAMGMNSVTSGLEILLKALDIEGSSVIVPNNTLFATTTAAIRACGEGYFADATDNLRLDPESIKKGIQGDTKGAMPIHIGALVPTQMGEIQRTCQEHDLHLIEIAAHAHRSTLDGKKAGSFGIVADYIHSNDEDI